MPLLSFVSKLLFKVPYSLIGRINLQGVVLILGLCLILCPWRHPLFTTLDSVLLKATTLLTEAPRGSADISIVDVPSSEFDLWQDDIYSAGKLGALISNILHSSDTRVGVLFGRPLDSKLGSADILLDDLAENDQGDNETIKQVRSLVQRKRFLLDTLTSDRVVLGVLHTRILGQKNIEILSPSIMENLPQLLSQWMWASQWSYLLHETPASRPSIDHYTLQTHLAQSESLAILNEQGGGEASFLLQLLNVVSDKDADLVWQRDLGVWLGENIYPTSPSGSFVALNTATDRMQPRISRITLEEALARGAFPSLVIIAEQGSEEAMRVARVYYSLTHQKMIAEPWWFAALEKIVVIFLVTYLLMVVPKISANAGYVASSALVASIIIVQIVAGATKGVWLPFGITLSYLLVGHMLTHFWQVRLARWENLSTRADNACIALAETQMEREQYEKVRETLNKCGNSTNVLNALYELGNAYSVKKHYQQAIDVFESLLARQSDYKDTSQKIDAIKVMIYSSPDQKKNEVGLDATVALPRASVQMQNLGRYEIKEEIGRGAMGTVYLGYDPKISRNVAIKTLKYRQFSIEQIGDIKSRFFREAEAAGRLSHPRIVSVYDVGEQEDLAYIAMDFVEGKALSEFVSEGRLLPIFEVYRITCEVAEALEYAHANQIIHRDIKPGNIMYNPAPYQLKVTDFGIARLVDDSKTSTGEILGSPLYMAPEQLKGKKVNFAADVFSLGVTFYQLLTGMLPFAGDNLASLTYEIIHGKHKNVRRVRKELPASAARIINQALQKDSLDRYSSAAEMANTLKKAIKRDFAHEAKQAGYL